MVYCDIEYKEIVKELLISLGITPRKFITQEETLVDWQKGGKLSQESNRQQSLKFLRLLLSVIDQQSKNDNKSSWMSFVNELSKLDLSKEIESKSYPIILIITKIYTNENDWELNKAIVKKSITDLIKIFEVKYTPT